MRALYDAGMITVDVDFLQISSYGTSRESSGDPQIIAPLTTSIKDKHVLVVEDIIDTGHTLKFVREYLQKQSPASLKLLAFLDKKAARQIEVFVDYVGFTLEGTPWVEGYGMDGGEFGRGRPEIAEKK
jgi:hypoxanthine phosphoribosyltransferase